MTLESGIEDYLKRRAKEEWLFLRKVCWIGRRYAPDRLLNNIYIELKRPGEKPCAGQLREHERMRKAGNRVEVIDSKEGIDRLINELTNLPNGAKDEL